MNLMNQARVTITDSVDEEDKLRDPFFQPANQAYVLKSVQELRKGKGKSHELIEVDDE